MADEEQNHNTFDNLDPDSVDAIASSEASAKDEELKSLNDKYLRLAAETARPTGSA